MLVEGCADCAMRLASTGCDTSLLLLFVSAPIRPYMLYVKGLGPYNRARMVQSAYGNAVVLCPSNAAFRPEVCLTTSLR